MTRLALLLVLLTACADIKPPPYDVWLVDVPAEHVAHWEAAVAAWNAQVGHEVLVLRDGAPEGRCGVHVKHRELDELGGALGRTRDIDCVWNLRYVTPCVAAHELGHVLGLEDVDVEPVASVMHAWDCPVPMPTAEDGVAVRERWGLE